MRISTNQMYAQGVRAVVDLQSEVANVQQQLGSGRRILKPSDDPVSSARLLELRQQVEATGQYQKNLTMAIGRLAVEESALQGAGTVLQRARELAVQGNNAPLTDADRRSIALEVRQLLGQLFDLANTKDGNNEYLFAGYKTSIQPFAHASGGGISYQGDYGQRLLQVGPTRQVAVGDSGAEVFLHVAKGIGSFTNTADPANTGTGVLGVATVTDITAYKSHSYRIQFTAANTFDVYDDDLPAPNAVLTGQTYVDGQAISFNGIETTITGVPAAGDQFTLRPVGKQDLFTNLENLAKALEAPANTEAERALLNQSMDEALVNLDEGISHLADVRARVGARLNALDTQDEANQEFTLRMKQIISDLDDLDYAEAASRLNQGLLILQAAQQSFVKIQGLSLFNYLR